MRVTRRQLLGLMAAAGAGAAGAGVYGVAVEPRRLVVTRLSVPVAGLPAALAGLRVGLASDIHHAGQGPDAMLTALAAALRTERPDLVLLAGDYVTNGDRDSVPPCAEILGALRPRFGCFAATGNHDPEAAVESAFEARGIRVLRDGHERIQVHGEPVAVGGLRYWSRKPEDVRRVFRGSRGFPILIAHDPRRVREAAGAEVPLVVSGHTHGGQVVLPGIGAPAAARFPVVYGLARRGGTTLFVSRGVGTVVLPVRINCPPEVVVLRLERL